MLIFFRSNQIFVSFLLALYLVVVHLGALMGTIQPVSELAESGLLYQSLFSWTNTSTFWSAVAAIVLVFIQSVSVNFLADEFRLMGERNWFPGLFYAMVASCFPEFLFVSAPLVAATFVPFSLWRIYNAFQKPNVTGAILDAALWIAVASLFYPPAIFLMLAAFAGIEVVRMFRLSERIVFMVGAATPLFLAWLWFFWLDKGAAFRDAQWGELFHLYGFNDIWDEKMTLKTGLLFLLLALFLYGLSGMNSRKGNQSQKFASVLYWFLVLGSISFVLRPDWHWEHFLLAAAPMGILLASTFQGLKNRLWAECWHLGLLALVFCIQFVDFFLSLSLPAF